MKVWFNPNSVHFAGKSSNFFLDIESEATPQLTNNPMESLNKTIKSLFKVGFINKKALLADPSCRPLYILTLHKSILGKKSYLTICVALKCRFGGTTRKNGPMPRTPNFSYLRRWINGFWDFRFYYVRLARLVSFEKWIINNKVAYPNPKRITFKKKYINTMYIY